MTVTSEQIYNEYRRQVFHISKNIYPKPIKNFEKQKAKSNWVFFENFASYVNRSSGHVDYIVYIKALASFYNGYFAPNLLGHPKGLKIYKNYIQTVNESNDINHIENSIKESIKFVANYCILNNIPSFNDYILEGRYMIPLLYRHYSAGSISKYFLAAIDNIQQFIKEYSTSETYDYLETFQNEYKDIRSKLVFNPTLLKYVDQIETIVNKIINKSKKQKN